jgi:hypothetical protein
MPMIKGRIRNVEATFNRKLSKLEKDWQPVADAALAFADAQLKFARNLHELWEEARELDKATETDEHKVAVKEKLQSLIDTTDESVFSRWQTIGKFADQLQPYTASLPPVRDSLHLLAQAAKEKAPIARWVKQHKLTPETPFKEIKLLRTEAKTGKAAPKKKSKASEQRVHKITLSFDGEISSNEIAKLLFEVVQSASIVRISSDTSIRQGLKSIMRDSFSTLEEKYHG